MRRSVQSPFVGFAFVACPRRFGERAAEGWVSRDDDPVHELVECRSAAIHAHVWHFSWQLNRIACIGTIKENESGGA